MKRLKAVLTLILVAASLFLLGCSGRSAETVSAVSIKANSFKSMYEVDERLNLDNVYILVTYRNNQTEYIKCESYMVVGFDTTTTGSKALHIEYEKVLSPEHSYEVTYSPDNTKQILTSARLEYSTEELNEILSYKVRLGIGDLTDVRAVMFSLAVESGEETLGIKTSLDNVSYGLPTGWYAQSVKVSEQLFRVLIFNRDNEKGIDGSTVFSINVNKGNMLAQISLIDIEAAEGAEPVKYYLPNYYKR